MLSFGFYFLVGRFFVCLLNIGLKIFGSWFVILWFVLGLVLDFGLLLCCFWCWGFELVGWGFVFLFGFVGISCVSGWWVIGGNISKNVFFVFGDNCGLFGLKLRRFFVVSFDDLGWWLSNLIIIDVLVVGSG